MSPEIFVVAGEASADMYGSLLMKEILRHQPQARFFGVGGQSMRECGLEVVAEAKELSVVGIADWVDRVGEVVGAYRRVVTSVKRRPPTCAVLLDLPDFNLRMAKHLKRLGVPIVYYISPQVWAWREKRVEQIKRLVRRLLVVFPFEKSFYAKHGVDATFVGHPLLDLLPEKVEYREPEQIRTAPRIALLPGSRRSEVRHHAPILAETIRLLRGRFPQAEIKVPIANTIDQRWIETEFATQPQIELVSGAAWDVLKWADVAAIASGTATLEGALIGVPLCLFYRVNWSSAFAFKHIIRYRNFIGMPNLLHQREVIRELFQERATAENLFAELNRLITDDGARIEMARDLIACRGMLGAAGASQRAAHEVLKVLER